MLTRTRGIIAAITGLLAGAVALAIPTAPDWRVSPSLHVISGTTRWAVTAARKS
jgi:hypothetical protein